MEVSHYGGMVGDRKGLTRERILDAAHSLVSRVGFRRTTFEDIASKAGVSRQTLYRHFGSKDDLMADLMDREADRFLQALRRLAPADVDLAGALEAGLVFTFDYLGTHPLLSWIHENEPDELLPHLRSHWSPLLDAVRRFHEPFIAAEVSSGRLSPERADIAGDWITHVVMAYMLLPGEVIDIRDPDTVARWLPSLILEGLKRPLDD